MSKTEHVAGYTGLTADQTGRFVVCLLAVGLEIVETKDYAALQTSHEDLVDALHRAVTEMKFWGKGHADAEIFIAEKALTNAAKLSLSWNLKDGG